MMTPTSGRKMSAQRIVFFSQFTCGTGIAEYIENATKIPLITLFILFSLPLSAIKFRKRFRKLHLHPVQFFHEAPQVFADNFPFPADTFLHPKRFHWKQSPTYHNMISTFLRHQVWNSHSFVPYRPERKFHWRADCPNLQVKFRHNDNPFAGLSNRVNVLQYENLFLLAALRCRAIRALALLPNGCIVARYSLLCARAHMIFSACSDFPEAAPPVTKTSIFSPPSPF